MIRSKLFIFIFLLTKISCDYICEDHNPASPIIFENLPEYKKSEKDLKFYSWIEFRALLTILEPQFFKKNGSNYIRKIDLANKGVRTIFPGAFDELFCLKSLNLKLNEIDDLNGEYFRYVKPYFQYQNRNLQV